MYLSTFIMTREQLLNLKREWAINKVIPAIYEEQILTALSYYPELRLVQIHFKLTDKHPVPYGTTPTFASIFKPAARRIYYVTLLEVAKEPERSALFKNLPYDAQVAVIAHELVHVIQYQSQTVLSLIKFMIMYTIPAFKKIIERAADKGAIEHGLGQGLYKHAVHLRNIPGYLQKRPEINKYYLKPHEILEKLKPSEKLGKA